MSHKELFFKKFKCYAYQKMEFSNEEKFLLFLNFETLDFLFEEERIKKEEKEISKIMIEQVEEEQKIQPIKKKAIIFFAANREKNKILILFLSD
jgi:UDP-galactopyranose mutase